MKKLIAMLCVMVIMPFAALAEIDLSGMSYDELVSLKDKINLAIWESQDWQEVTVPQGIWLVGKDIPAGHYTLTCAGEYAYIKIGDVLDEMGKDIDHRASKTYYGVVITSPNWSKFEPHNDLPSDDINLTEGLYVYIEDGDVIFSPYAGKPSLGFE